MDIRPFPNIFLRRQHFMEIGCDNFYYVTICIVDILSYIPCEIAGTFRQCRKSHAKLQNLSGNAGNLMRDCRNFPATPEVL
jgi:hypothetical protein